MPRPQFFDRYPVALHHLLRFGPFPAVMESVTDGDTLNAWVDQGADDINLLALRVQGVNTPEKNALDPAERARGLAARAFLAELLPPLTPLAVTLLGRPRAVGTTPTLQRWVATVAAVDAGGPYDLAARIITAGYGVPMAVGVASWADS